MIYYIGVDVGSGSVRAALFSSGGQLVSSATCAIKTFEPRDSFYEQSSDDIWEACCKCIHIITENVDKQLVAGIGFDATCSLVALDKHLKPVTVSPSEQNKWNVVMWMDHRAAEEATCINTSKHDVLGYVGGAVSLEMQMPKLKWLKRHLRSQCWDMAEHFFDLPDYLTWRATGSMSRSLCSLVCKWTYMCAADGYQGWRKDFLQAMHLEELAENNFSKIGSAAQSPGSPCGDGLTEQAAKELGLLPNTPVATSMIDAHAGGLGCLSCKIKQTGMEGPDAITADLPVRNRLALICGTSTCHMAVSKEPLFVEGVWGPYYSAMVPEMWCNEAGQSAAGKLIDHILKNHAAYSWVEEDAKSKKKHVHDVLNSILEFMAQKGETTVTELTREFHIYPDFHGNRSPLADANMRGMICGLTLSAGVEDLALHYLAAIQALAYSSRQILEDLQETGHDLRLIHMCGGLSKNPLYVQAHADVTCLPVVIPNEAESVLLGAAILGAYASGKFQSIKDAMDKMGGDGKIILPEKRFEGFHARKYNVYLKLQKDQQEYKRLMLCSS